MRHFQRSLATGSQWFYKAITAFTALTTSPPSAPPPASGGGANGTGMRGAYRHHTLMRRYASADEIAAAIVFLLDGAQSSYITGAILPVDGGFAGAGMMEIEV